MTQQERRLFLIKELIKEQPRYYGFEIPADEGEQKRLLRSLLNVRMPKAVGKDFLEVQDVYLREEISAKGITDIENLSPVKDNLYLWQGDITTLRCDAIVNAANSQMLGCFCPCHGCIDNAIHTFAGVQLRLECAELMKRQGYEEPVGRAKITSAYNLPCKKIIHTVGPYVSGRVTENDKTLLESCYRSCLELCARYREDSWEKKGENKPFAKGEHAKTEGLKSIAFCCISTGEFHFPNTLAAQIAVDTVRNFIRNNNSEIEVIFNVFKDSDKCIYEGLLK